LVEALASGTDNLIGKPPMAEKLKRVSVRPNASPPCSAS